MGVFPWLESTHKMSNPCLKQFTKSQHNEKGDAENSSNKCAQDCCSLCCCCCMWLCSRLSVCDTVGCFALIPSLRSRWLCLWWCRFAKSKIAYVCKHATVSISATCWCTIKVDLFQIQTFVFPWQTAGVPTEVTSMSYDKCKRNVMCYNSWHVHWVVLLLCPSMQISPASPAQLASRTQIQFSGDEHPLKLVQHVHSMHMYRDYADAASKIVLKGQSAAQACCMCKATAHYG